MLKFAIHGAGYISETGVPRTAADANAVVYSETNQVGKSSCPVLSFVLIDQIGWIPEDSLQVLRTQLASVYPELAKSQFKPFLAIITLTLPQCPLLILECVGTLM